MTDYLIFKVFKLIFIDFMLLKFVNLQDVVCMNVNCLNGGFCIHSPSGAMCQCATGFSGLNCEVVNCGGTFDGIFSGTISSPGYPISYPNNADCIWKFNEPMGATIQLTFSTPTFADTCDVDYVAIFNGNNTNAPMLGK